jgi:peptidoglycan/LPS O-acetylase OafA/YrhL
VKYRKEIDGLRSLAVLPVILHHAKIKTFSGGFVGVDVFFVISGFLISKIIYDDIAGGRFSIIHFYERRIRRIMPALVLVIAICSAAAACCMMPKDLDNYAQSVVATLLFANNVLLTLTSGYWDMSSDFKPLLHTWSLAVEEQFYVFYPILLLLIVRARAWVFPLVLTIGCLASFAASIALSSRYPNASFYLIHTRTWELLLGALAAYVGAGRLASGRFDNALSLAGLVAIIASIFLFDETLSYPSFYAALPCLGAVLILVSATPGTIANRLLSTPLLVGIGLISYSAYLWHQPLFAFARVLSVAEPAPALMVALCGLTLGLAYLSWRYVEQPFRDPRRITRGPVFAFAAVTSALLVALGLATHLKAGFPSRVPGVGLGEERFIAYNERGFAYKKDAFSTSRPHVLVIGNSTARDFINVMLESGRFAQYEIVYRDDATICNRARATGAVAGLMAVADLIIWPASFKAEPDCQFIDLAAPPVAGKPLIVVGPKHFGYNLNRYIFTPIAARSVVRAPLMRETILANNAYRHLVPAANYQDLLATMKVRFGGVPVFDGRGRILTADRVHLTQAGARFFAAFVFDDPVWQPAWALRQASAPRPVRQTVPRTSSIQPSTL